MLKEKTTKRTIKIGLIGCGRAADQLHLPALRRVAGIEVVALADVNRQRLDVIADRFGVANRHSDYRALLDDPSVEAVAVCVPPQHHVETALAALDAGKHLFIEKPLALSLDDCDRLIERASRTPYKTMVGLNFRQHRLVRQARQLIQQGALGQLELLRSSYTAATRHRFQLPAWRNRRELGGGVLVEIATHHFDLWRFLLGCDVQQIFACSQGDNAEDQASAVTARMTNGVLVSAVFCERTYDNSELEVFGHAGRLRLSLYCFDGLEYAPTFSYPGDVRSRLRGLARTLAALPRGLATLRRGGDYLLTYEQEWRRFADAILHDAPIDATLADGRAAVEIALAAVESVAHGRPVNVAEAARGIELMSATSVT